MTYKDMKDKSIKELFVHLLKLISSERFLKRVGLGSEVPFFICPYDPIDMIEMEDMVNNLQTQLASKGIKILSIDLYKSSLEILERRNLLERIFKEEQEMGKDELKELLQGVLDAEKHLIPFIKEQMSVAEFDVMFITGVGHVFPFIRSHNVLNNLQKTAKDQPTVMFFPGEYTFSLENGASLDLFGRLHDDKYYRAFNIYNYEI